MRGDILQAGGITGSAFAVEWDTNRNGWNFNRAFVNETYDGEPTQRSASVIGNIYDNPDLL